jgi:hypothetical protein
MPEHRMSERWPAALRLDQAAEYTGLSVDIFKEVCTVAPIQFTKSSHGRRWLRARLDEWLDSLDPNNAGSATPPRRRLAERIGDQGRFEGPSSL